MYDLEKDLISPTEARGGWEEEFDRVFVIENLWKSDDQLTANVPIENIKHFIRKTLSSQRAELLQEVEGLKVPCIGNPDMMLGLEDRFTNSAIDQVIKIIKDKE